MAIIVNSSEENPFIHNPSYEQVNPEIHVHKIRNGKTYEKLKYQKNLSCLKQFFTGCATLICTLTVIPIMVMGWRNFKKLWKVSLSGVDRKVVFVAAERMGQNKKDEGAAPVQDGGKVNNPDDPGLEIEPQVITNKTDLFGFHPRLFETASSREVLALQARIKVTNPKYPALDLTKLAEDNLLPLDKYTIDGATYYCSKPFKPDSKHYLVLALVQIEDKVYPRIFYSSNSQGTWRCMPAASKNGEGKLMHYGKGLAENDTQLPFELNFALQMRGLENYALPLNFKFSDLLRTDFNFNETYKGKINLLNLVGLLEGAPKMFMKGGNMVPRSPNPKLLKMPQDLQLHPDFTFITEYQTELKEYGKIEVKIVPSKDRSLQYAFYETIDGRTFLASVEKIKDNPINAYGLRGEALELENMDAPLLEYEIQIPPGYEPAKRKENRYESKDYVNNWNYIRELEIIQLYYAEQKRELPPKI